MVPLLITYKLAFAVFTPVFVLQTILYKPWSLVSVDNISSLCQHLCAYIFILSFCSISFPSLYQKLFTVECPSTLHSKTASLPSSIIKSCKGSVN